MSGESYNQEIIDAMKFGAIEFLWKPFAHTQLVQAIDKGLRLGGQLHSDQQRLLRVDTLHQCLSPREKSMFAFMLLGHSNKEIASATSVLADTVKKHRAKILAKMPVNSLAELLALCKNFNPPSSED